MITALPSLVLSALLVGAPASDDLLTVAEASDYQATARHAEVMDLLDRIESKSTIMHLTEMGRSVEGKSLPLAIIANPPIETAQQAKDSGKLRVFAFANIHAGEVCGKEALLMLCRELALDPDHPLLDDLVVILAPIYNADGNDMMAVDNRPGQMGPAQGMGQRPNAQGLDLNRDNVKLESPEARAMARLLTEWDPHLTVDTHTTNGSSHRYTLTYAAPLNPAGPEEPVAFVRDTMLPEIMRRLRARTGYDSFFYGNFNRDQTVWATYSASPNFGGPCRGLRGQMSILSEAYSYAPYKDRVLVTREFVREIMQYAAEQRETMIEIHERTRQSVTDAGRSPQPDDLVGLRYRLAAMDEPAIIRGYEIGVDENGRRAFTETPRDYKVRHLGRFESTLSVRRPYAYVVLPEAVPVLEERLARHGIDGAPCAGDAMLEVYTVTEIRSNPRRFQGHNQVRIDVNARVERRRIPDGSMLYTTAQPLGTLLVYLLEPQSSDGLASWNVLEGLIEVDGIYPIMRVRSPADLLDS